MGTPAFEKPEGRTADPSTSLRSGRDDKGEGIASMGRALSISGVRRERARLFLFTSEGDDCENLGI